MLLEKTKIYGVDGVGKSSPTLERTDASVGLGYTKGVSEIYSDFDKCYPWCEMHEVVDELGNVFIRIPKFYTKITKNDDGSYKHQISGCRYDGFSTLFIDGKGNELDYILVGKYEGSCDGSDYATAKMKSVSGATVKVSITIDNYRKACRNNGVSEFMTTIWNKGECDIFCNLLALSVSAELCYDKKPSMEKLKRRFEATTGGIFDAFWDMSLYHNDFSNPEEYQGHFGHHKRFFGKVIFWQDVLMGLYDYDIYNKPMSDHYYKASSKYKSYCGGRWEYMYRYVELTLALLAVKSEIAEKIRPAYISGDKETLTHIKDVLLPKLYELTEKTYQANKSAWMRDFKTISIKILNSRYGFMKERIVTAIELLGMYLDGEIDRIEELDEKRLKSRFFGFDGYNKIAGV